MSRNVVIQVSTPAAVLGVVLFVSCLASAWYINRLHADLTNILSENVASLEAAQELEICVRQLRFHGIVYLLDPGPERMQPIRQNHEAFEQALDLARRSANTPEERAWLQKIGEGYRQYHTEMIAAHGEPDRRGAPADLARLTDEHPIRHVVEPCEALFRFNKQAMEQTARESARASGRVQLAMLLLGFGGPVGGLVAGYGIARGLSRSIARLSVRVQGMAERLDHKVASVKLTAGGNVQDLDEQLQHVVRRVEEVTERLQRQQLGLLRAEQLAAVGQLAASVAHEVRNPLTSIKLLVGASLRPHKRKSLNDEDLRVIHAEVVRLEQTVQDFLDFARPPALRRAPCDLRQVVTQATELVQARARQQGVGLDVECPDRAVAADVDRSQLCNVLVNLLINALDAMPRGGCLEVSLGADRAGVRLAVADSGPGIPAEMMSRLFTPFASGKPTGTGLGLSISRRVVEEHGGEIRAANRREGGACFTVTLPAPTTV